MGKTSEENWMLLEGLYQHGSNIEALAKACPSWSRSELNMAIQRYRLRAQKQRERESEDQTELEQWLAFSKDLHELQGTTNKTRGRRGRRTLTQSTQDQAPLLSKIMMYSACFEEHWEASRPEDPNYSEIYRYLSQLLSGSEPTHLSPGSASKVLEMLKRIKQVTSDVSVTPHLNYLQRLPLQSLKPSSQKLETLQQESASLLQKVPGLNPMDIPAEMMLKPPFTT